MENTLTGHRELLIENKKFKLVQQQLRQCFGPCCADGLFKRNEKKNKRNNNNNTEHAKQSEGKEGCSSNASHFCLERLRKHYCQAQSNGTFKV